MNTMEKELDRQFLISYYKEMVDEIGEIFQLFLEEMPADLQQLNENIALGDFSKVAELLHKIAPCFYNVGLPALTKEVQSIEASIHAGETSLAPSKIAAFQLNYNEYLPAILQESNRLNANVN
jgi:HPt (histidine-containing phosphotransfer) domain-containing protein